jgi:YgiT-type zinc finger domain-containing protein
MTCMYCQGEMTRGTAPLHIDRKDCHLILDRVPAWICRQCGESYFEEKEVQGVQELIRAIESKTQDLALSA